MVKYLVTAVAAIYCVLLIFGDDSRRPEVTRQAADDVTGFSLASLTVPAAVAQSNVPVSTIGDAEAVEIAMQAARDLRANRERKPLRGMIAAIETPAPAEESSEATQAVANLWYVTGTTVNLRAGPGTGNAVVGQVALGDAAEVLSDEDGWYRIRTAKGGVEGWIFGRFLSKG